ncbi:Mediator of RNA polymerase II transcription subunit 18 [Fasciola hepatica]|uniref:Mediator of RNA polymerase II transcription subunit 18 n=1 Tax=Fasciola hepatica TaxID=6192 RepID=A0A4E0RWN0_FASHE|nr:Mediator of RNA polymerase II transcription subunit 18 [Fasciola hepatica]
MDETMSVLLPGESGSIAEVLGPTEGLGQAGASEITDVVSSTAAFHFTGTSASANGATMQEYFIQSAISTPQQHELLITRLRGLCQEWTEFCDQEIVLQLGGDDRADNVAAAMASRTTANSSAAAGVLASSGQIGGRVTVRVRKSLNAKHRLSYVRYLGAVETDKLVSRRSCLEVPVCGPLIGFLQELGFDQDFTYVAEGHMFVRGRVKTVVYTVNEVVQFQNPTASDSSTCVDFSGLDPLPKEWRRICPRSWMVEISAVGCPADESMQDEVSDFVDLLHPLIVPAKIDHAALIRK